MKLPECPNCGKHKWRGVWLELSNKDWREIDRQINSGKTYETEYVTCPNCKEELWKSAKYADGVLRRSTSSLNLKMGG